MNTSNILSPALVIFSSPDVTGYQSKREDHKGQKQLNEASAGLTSSGDPLASNSFDRAMLALKEGILNLRGQGGRPLLSIGEAECEKPDPLDNREESDI